MAKWKLTRHIYGLEEYSFSEGDKITVGRGVNNDITLSSAVISRNHCVINVQNNKILITDLQSSNGVYVGSIKIPPHTAYVIEDSEIVGLGWTTKAQLVNIKDSEKYVFKVSKETTCRNSLTSRITFQSDNDMDAIEAQIAKLDGDFVTEENKSPIISNKLSLKRKIDDKNTIKNIKEEKIKSKVNNDDGVVNIISDSDNENRIILPCTDKIAKKPKLEAICEEIQNLVPEIKAENELLEYEAFNVKQEYLGYNDEPIAIESDSDNDSESEHWLLRLSQNSPGKPFIKIAKSPKAETRPEDNSYSQLDDFESLNFPDEEEFEQDLITIPPEPAEAIIIPDEDPIINNFTNENEKFIDVGQESDQFSDDIISFNPPIDPPIEPSKDLNEDVVDGLCPDPVSKPAESPPKQVFYDSLKKAQMIEPQTHAPKGKSHRIATESKTKKSSSSKHSKSGSSSKKHISNSQKEERKKKLKEIAYKDKKNEQQTVDSPGSSKAITNIKVTSSNRGAFLTDIAHAVVKPVKRKENANRSKDKSIDTTSSPKEKECKNKEVTEDVEKNKKETEKSKKDRSKESKCKENINRSTRKSMESDRAPLKSLKPLTDSEEVSGKPVSKVGPMQTKKTKKQVRFSEAAPQVLEFEIEPGNKMKKTSLVKTLVDLRHTPVFSLEKITLMKILRWNPQWLEEQINNNDPPPILGHNNTPMTVFHSFANHQQYVQLIGDLLLMEIWECLTIAYMKIRNHSQCLQMRIESLPPMPTPERFYDLYSISVNLSVPAGVKNMVPRVGDMLYVTFGPENAQNHRFFFVHNVRTIPSPPNNIHAFYSISLHATFTDKMATLRPGELIIGRTLTYINKELNLFEAMEYLAGSPLSDAILRPEPHHFIKKDQIPSFNLNSQWTNFLNPSQLTAVSSSVAAALSDRPSIQMVQGPPGTGKSSVICAIVMTYFYNAHGKREQNRGKLLICATSNAAVDGLVARLLKLRASLPKPERFRMVRVGREEAMHPLAANVSSQQLAARELARLQADQPVASHIGLDEEILHVEAKLNGWKTAAMAAKDPVRVAYCEGKVADLVKRMTLLRCGTRARSAPRPEHVAAAERRIIEGADIVVTTLASAHNAKMRGLKRRIALCIIDEAGQVIEPETLIPLTLDVTRLTLIGDPQQLPGFICSQRAKKHGLSESLFSRLTSCAENWPSGSPVVLLNQQYRMHPDIADYPSRAFYDGRVLSVAPTRPAFNLPPYALVSISSGDKGQGQSGANEMEAWGVSRLVMALDTILRPLNLKLAVITPYNAHKDLIKKNLKFLQQQGESAVEVNTVDSFQGQERDVVVVSLARSSGVGFLTDAGRMNVMLTRARHALLVCLNPHALLKNHQWRTLVDDAHRRNLYRTLPNKMCQPVTSSQVPTDEILKYIINQKPNHYSHR